MNGVERKKEILRILSQKESVDVDELTRIFGVSKVTVRSDLDSLEAKGLLIRTHGGALSAENQKLIRIFTDTMTEEAEEKERIARTASSLVHDGDTVIIDTGSTTVHITKYLKGKNITAVTSSLLAMNALMNDETVELIMLPGMLRRYSMGAIGPLTKSTLHEIHADILFLGASAISEDGVWSSNLVEADTKRSMIKAADTVCLLADSKKLRMKGLGRISPWSEIDVFVTDSIPDDFRQMLEKTGVKVMLAPEE